MNTTELTAKREIGIITAEIITIREHTNRMVLENSIEIGRRLLEAKEVVGHGNWGEYLREQVDFSPSTANNLMKLCQEYGDTQLELGKAPKSQTFGNLTYSQAVILLALPAETREEVVAEHDMENTSVRELQAIIEEKKREAETARKEAEKAKTDMDAAIQDKKQAMETAKKQEKELAAAREEIKKLESRPVEVAVQSPSQEEMDTIRREAEEAVSKKMGEEIDTLREELEETRQVEKQQTARTVELEKKLAMAENSDMVEFNILFRRLQEELEKLYQKYLAIQAGDPEQGKKLKLAMAKFSQLLAKKWEG